MSHSEEHEEQAAAQAAASPAPDAEASELRALGTGASEGELLSRIELVEAQPLAQRAAGFEQLHDDLLTELQRGDHGGS